MTIQFNHAPTTSGLFVSSDDGQTFIYNSHLQASGNPQVLNIFESNSVLYVSTAEGLAVSSDGGQSFTWPLKTSQPLWFTYAYGNSIYSIGYNSNLLYISSDGGKTFTSKVVGSGGTLMHVTGRGSTLYVSSATGLWVSTDGGQTFTAKTLLKDANLGMIKVAFWGNSIYALSGLAGLFVSNDNGATFASVKGTPPNQGGALIEDFVVSGNYVFSATIQGLYIGAF